MFGRDRRYAVGVRLFTLLLLLSTLVAGVPARSAWAQDDSTEANKALVMRLVDEVFNQQNMDVVAEIYAPNFVEHRTWEEFTAESIDDVVADIAGTFETFPDIQITIDDMIAEGDRVVARYTLASETAGVMVHGVYIARIEDGKVVEAWDQGDDLGMMTQLGVIEMPPPGPVTIASGFNGPMGVLVDPDGNVWVIDSGLGGETEVPFVDPESGEDSVALFGDTARIVQIAPDGTQTEVATLPSIMIGEEATGGARLALLDGVLYATSGGWIEAAGPESLPLMGAVVQVEEGAATEVANTWAFEVEENPDGLLPDTHPYGLAAGPDGMLWVADAGANALLKVDPATGEITLAAAFEGVPSPMPNPGRGDAMESDPVPTGVAVDEDGNAFVAFLPGFPFLPGSAKVVMVNADGEISDYATGLSMITDLRPGPDEELYAVQIAQFTEEGPVPDSGAIIRVLGGDASEVVVGGLSFPTSIDFDADGNAYITVNGMGAPGSGEVVMVAGVTGMAGEPIVTPPTAEEIAEQNLAVVQGLYDEFAAGNADVILETHGETLTMHYAGQMEEVETQALYEEMAAIREANPDLHAEIHGMAAAGDYVFTDLTWAGTHTGDFFGIPATGNPVMHNGIVVRRLEDGVIVESWEIWDDLAFLNSLGLVPSWDEIVAAAQP